MLNKVLVPVLALLTLAAGSAWAKGDAVAGQRRASVFCVNCHGANGVSPTDAWPNLAGQGVAYLVKQLKAFRDGTRADPMMVPLAKTLSDQDIENLAAFFSRPEAVAAAAASAPTPAAAGAEPHPPIIASDIVVPHRHTTRQYWADQLPQGEGRGIIVQKCQLCHDLQRAIAFARPKRQWQDVVNSMIRRGSPVTAEETPVLVDYLTQHFGMDSPTILGPAGVQEVGIKPCKPSEWPKGSSDFRANWTGKYNIWLSNQQGGNIDIVDAVTKKMLRRIGCISAPDRVEFSRDGNTAYAPDRVEHNVTVIDTRTGAIKAKIPLIDERPNTAVLSRDFNKLYVGIWPVTGDEDKRGYVQIIDTATLKVTKTITTQGGIHDTWMSADGKMLLAMSPSGKFMNVYDTRTDKLLYTCCTNAEIGTMTMETGPDGSTSRFFISYAGFYGIVAIDAKTGKELQRVAHPRSTGALTGGAESYLSTTGSGFHGGEISPDGKSLWVISGSIVYRYALPSLKLLGSVHLALVDQSGQAFRPAVEGSWLTIAPDGRKVYAVRPGRNLLSVVDAATMKEEALVPTGEYPLHISVWPRGTP